MPSLLHGHITITKVGCIDTCWYIAIFKSGRWAKHGMSLPYQNHALFVAILGTPVTRVINHAGDDKWCKKPSESLGLYLFNLGNLTPSPFHIITPLKINSCIPKNWRLGSDDVPDFHWVIFRVNHLAIFLTNLDVPQNEKKSLLNHHLGWGCVRSL